MRYYIIGTHAGKVEVSTMNQAFGFITYLRNIGFRRITLVSSTR